MKSLSSHVLEIRFHHTEGTIASFIQEDRTAADKILRGIHPVQLFNQQRIIIAGTYSVTVFVTAHLTRIDFVRDEFFDWPFPAGFSDVVELPEKEFRRYTQLDQPDQMQKRSQERIAGDLFVAFLDLEMVSGQHVFLGFEGVVDLPAERFIKLQYLLTSPTLHARLPTGGNILINLGNVVRFTVYPGPASAPPDAWPAHHKTVTV